MQIISKSDPERQAQEWEARLSGDEFPRLDALSAAFGSSRLRDALKTWNEAAVDFYWQLRPEDRPGTESIRERGQRVMDAEDAVVAAVRADLETDR